MTCIALEAWSRPQSRSRKHSARGSPSLRSWATNERGIKVSRYQGIKAFIFRAAANERSSREHLRLSYGTLLVSSDAAKPDLVLVNEPCVHVYGFLFMMCL